MGWVNNSPHSPFGTKVKLSCVKKFHFPWVKTTHHYILSNESHIALILTSQIKQLYILTHELIKINNLLP